MENKFDFETMNSLIKITFKGTFSRQRKINVEELDKHYQVKQLISERFSGADGSSDGPLHQFLTIVVDFGTPLALIFRDYLKEKAIEYIFESQVLKPFVNWLSQNDLDSIADEIDYRFDDITIRIGYSKKNHLVAAGLLCNYAFKIKEIFRSENVGEINLIASPLKAENKSWKFYIPSKEFLLNNYLDCLGIELNRMNKCVIVKDEVLYENWT